MRVLVVLAVVGALIVGVPLLVGDEPKSPSEAFVQAVIDGRVDEVRGLLAAGVDPNEPIRDSRHPLEHAARAGHLDVVALLLAHGAVIPERTKPERAAASLALAGGHDAVLRLLLLAGSKLPPDCPDTFWRYSSHGDSGPILFLVAADGDEELARSVVEAGFSIDEARAKDGMRPLSGAAIAGDVSIAKLLLERGADANAPTNFGRTPLHHAALGGKREIVEALLASGADPSVPDQLGWTPLHLAALCGHGLAVSALAAPSAAARSLDIGDSFGWSPLMRAMTSGDAFAVDELLAAGADVHAASSSGRTALHIAAERRHDDLYERLVAAGASEDAQDSLGATPRELRGVAELPIGDLEPRKVGEPIVRAGWFKIDFYTDGWNVEFNAWDDGVVIYSDLLSSYPWTTAESLQIGRIPAARARRLSVELEESSLFRHPIYDGLSEIHGTTRFVARRASEGDEQSFKVPFEQTFANVDWRFEPETNATLGRLWLDVQAILTSARPSLTEPLTAHFVDPRFIGEGSFRGISWTK